MKTNLCLMALSLISTVAHADTWDSTNSPKIFESDYEYRLSVLPIKGALPAEKAPWSETYWPSNKGSINYRWNAVKKVGFGYNSPTREQALRMSKEELAQLSPAEKYDLAMGRYDYPLKQEVRNNSSKNAKDWAGICNGWSPAALQYAEPIAVEVPNADGIVVPFGSSDVKGLLSYFMAFHAELKVTQIGKRCFKMAKFLGLNSCDDVNAGAFHVVVANELGARGRGFVADMDPGNEVWNQPVYGYEVLESSAPRSTSQGSEVTVKMKLYYTDELDDSQWKPVVGTDQFKFVARELQYTLELDSSGKIVGGEWISKNHPDFLWRANQAAVFSGGFEGLSRIYQY
jgi:hypothetical protein